MKRKKRINCKIKKKELLLSQQMLIAYNEKKNPLESEFICVFCFGILLNPVKCKNCGAACCESCLNSLPRSKITCYCRKCKKRNFQPFISQDLLISHYYCKTTKGGDSQILNKNYIELLSEIKIKTCKIKFIDSEESVFNCVPFPEYQKQIKCFYHKKLLIKCKQSKQSKHHFDGKGIKIINFHFANGFQLKLFEKRICIKIIKILYKLNLCEIFIEDCIWGINSIFSLSQAIKKHSNLLKSFSLILGEYMQHQIISLKQIQVIFQSISLCPHLINLRWFNNFNDYPIFIFPKSLYSFLYSLLHLNFLELKNNCFTSIMNLDFFEKLYSLTSISFQNCKFAAISFISLIEKIIGLPSTKKLNFNYGFFIDKFDIPNQDIILKKLAKNFRIRELKLMNDFYDIDRSFNFYSFLIKFLIQTKNYSLNILKLFHTELGFYSKTEEFFLFLQGSQIYQLEIKYMRNDLNFDIPLFYKYLQSSTIIQKISLIIECKIGLEWNLFLNAITYNLSIKELVLQSEELDQFNLPIIYLIRNNKSLVSLSLVYTGKFHIKSDFAEAILSNKSLQYLRIKCDTIDIKAAELLVKSNLKGICLKYFGDESIRAFINEKIPECYLKWRHKPQ